jgi:hypothetical protein
VLPVGADDVAEGVGLATDVLRPAPAEEEPPPPPPPPVALPPPVAAPVPAGGLLVAGAAIGGTAFAEATEEPETPADAAIVAAGTGEGPV